MRFETDIRQFMLLHSHSTLLSYFSSVFARLIFTAHIIIIINATMQNYFAYYVDLIMLLASSLPLKIVHAV